MKAESVLPWSVSLFTEGMTSIWPKSAKVKNRAALVKMFGAPPIREPTYQKKALPCWSPALYKTGDKRSNPNVQAVTALVYDFDHATERPEVISSRLRKLRAGFILHTTWSHRPSEPRYRIILFLSRALQPKEYPVAWENGLRLIGYDAGVDRQARNISRHYALPAHCRGEEYLSDIYLEGGVLDTDKVSAPQGETKEQQESNKPRLSRETVLKLDEGGAATVELILSRGPGKYKCICPFQHDASPGSAFLRVTRDKRCFLQCTSERHTHEGAQFWLTAVKSKYSARSVEDRMQRISEVPQSILEYVEDRLAYNALQGVFYRHSEGAWHISTPMRKDPLTDHIVGLLPQGCDKHHASALVDHIISRQVYGFDCQSSKDRVVRRNEVSMLNLYAWPDLHPVEGDWPRIEKILDLLCDGDPVAKKWLLHWSASLVQHPQRRSMVAVLVLSPQQGIGKSMYGRLLAEVIGKGNSVVVSNKALRDSFNSHYVTSLLVLADEVGIERNAGDVIAEVKAAVTDDRVHCSAPYAARTTVTNRMSWWLTSNQRRPFLVEKDDRRFTILSPAQATSEYRKMLRDCFDPKTSRPNPGFYSEIQAFAHDLKTMDVDWRYIARPFSSKMKTELQAASMGSVDAFIAAIAREGVSEILSTYPPPPDYFKISDSAVLKAVPCETLYGCYRQWCGKKGRSDIRSETLLRLAMKDLPKLKVRSARIAGTRLDVYTGLPSRTDEPKEGKVIKLSQ